jgi:hypothetical protein
MIYRCTRPAVTVAPAPDDSGTWNLLILREYASVAAMEAKVEKADAITQQSAGTDEVQMQGYDDTSKYRTVGGTSTLVSWS